MFDAVIVGAGVKHSSVPKAAIDYFTGPTFTVNVALAKRLAPLSPRLVLSASHGLLLAETTAWHAMPTRPTHAWARNVEATIRKLYGPTPRVLALCAEGLLGWAPSLRAAGATVSAPVADLTSSQHRALGRFAEKAPRDIAEFRRFARRIAQGLAP